MTGAGSAQVAFVKEDAFDSVPGAPTYYLPGRNVRVQDLSLGRQLARMREPGTVEAVESLAGNLDGAFAVSYSMSSDIHDDVRDIVFNSGGTGFTTGLAPTSSWYVGTNFLDTSDTEQTVERHLQACIPLEYEIAYQVTENTIRETLTMGYADESRNTSFTPGSITTPDDGNDVAFHGTALTIDNSTVSRLQACTLRFSNLYRFIQEPSFTPVTAVLAAPQTTLTTRAVLHTDDYLEYAYGGSTGTTSAQATISNISNSDLAFDIGGTVVARYNMSTLKANSHSHENLVTGDTDDIEAITWNVDGGISVATS